ncbi:MAG TPA: hypothetical protein VJU77_17400 [Chthoniobacterales bacterium]|nr:hypothetical protein [Chthoniobacterales bacterium]
MAEPDPTLTPALPRRIRSAFTLFALAVVMPWASPAPSAQARPGGKLLLATSAEDPVLRARLVSLSPSVNPEEARHVTFIAYTTGLELARKWDMGSSPTMHSFLINIGARKAGYCYQFATELLLRLEAQNFKTLEFHWAESDVGTDTEHNVIAVTARGQPFEQAIMLDLWRRSGRLLWGPFEWDVDHTWQENKAAYFSRVKRKPAGTDQARKNTVPKKKTPETKTR